MSVGDCTRRVEKMSDNLFPFWTPDPLINLNNFSVSQSVDLEDRRSGLRNEVESIETT